MKSSRVSILVISAVCALCGCSKGSKKEKSSSATSSSQAPSTKQILPYEEVFNNYDSYYAHYNFKELYGDELKAEMHKYFILEHQTYVTYQNYWYYANGGSDLIPGTEQNELFYTAKRSNYRTHENQDREHVWPCANSGNLWRREGGAVEIATEHNIDATGAYAYWGGGSDLYHVRPATSSVNQKRSDSKFYEFSDAELAQQTRLSDGGPYVAYVDALKNKVEVADEFKGDVARIIMYIWIHYSSIGSVNVYYSPEHKPVYSLNEAINEPGHSPYVCGLISLKNILAYDTETECMEKIVEWNRIDPPSAVELNRNNYVETVQGNRNPFVDYPQLVDHILYY